jgi:hydroxyacylglutathione hydrolase
MLEVVRFICGPLANNVSLWIDAAGGACAVVDPGMECQPVHDYIAQHLLQVRLILNTHGHFDHSFANAEFMAAYAGARLAIHPGDLAMLRQLPATAAGWGFSGASASPEPDILLEHLQRLELGGEVIEVRHTPGHSPGQVAFINGLNALVGDTLFNRGVGRWDLPGSDFAALERSIREQLYTLPDATVVWPGHGEQTTIGEERRLNPYIGDGARFIPKL